MAQFESKSKFQVIHVNVDNKSDMAKYKKHFQGRSIPYWAVLDKSGKKVHGFVGGQTYKTLVAQTKKYK